MMILFKPLQWIYSLYAFILFVGIMLLVFPFALIATLFGRIKGGNMILWLCRRWGDVWFPLIFIFPKRIYEAPHNRKKAFIFVSNHISYMDAATVVKAYRQPIRPLGKIETSKVPVFGFIYRNAIVTVDRSDALHRTKSVSILKSILGKGISILVFPEGTFNKTTEPVKDFYDGAFRIAIETRTPLKPVLFLDSYRRLSYKSFFSLTPGRCRILYLDEIPVNTYDISDIRKLKMEVHAIMKRKMIEYDGSWRKKGN